MHGLHWRITHKDSILKYITKKLCLQTWAETMGERWLRWSSETHCHQRLWESSCQQRLTEAALWRTGSQTVSTNWCTPSKISFKLSTQLLKWILPETDDILFFLDTLYFFSSFSDLPFNHFLDFLLSSFQHLNLFRVKSKCLLFFKPPCKKNNCCN